MFFAVGKDSAPCATMFFIVGKVSALRATVIMAGVWTGSEETVGGVVKKICNPAGKVVYLWVWNVYSALVQAVTTRAVLQTK